MDPFQGLAKYLLGRLEQSTIAAWWRFLVAMGLSGILSFLFVCGVSLCRGVSPSISIGAGMVSSAMCMAVCFRMYPSKLLAGLPIVLPTGEAKVELETDVQVIEKH